MSTLKKRQLIIRKYIPPSDVTHRLRKKDLEREPANLLIRVVKKFFGDGF